VWNDAACAALVAQDPILFSGTLRYNLDPTGTHKEAELWESLEAVQMREYVEGQPDKLNMPITKGGENLSVGQRQLVCMSRALLRKSRVMVLDEATASTDVTSDAIIQRRLRELTGVTQLTIAHRLNTVLDSSRILVLDKGQVAEFDTPARLLANPESRFAKLVADSAASEGEAAAPAPVTSAPAAAASSGSGGGDVAAAAAVAPASTATVSTPAGEPEVAEAT